MAELTLTTYLNGISALIVLLAGLFMGIRILFLYREKKKKLMPVVAIMGIFMGIFYLGPTTSFISLLLDKGNINGILYGFLSYSLTPITITLAVYLGYDIFKPEMRNKVVYFYLSTGIVFYIAFFGFPTLMIEPSIPSSEGELLDISLRSVIMVLAGFYLLTALFVLGRNFNGLKKRLPEGKDQNKARDLSIGWTLFAIGGFLDTLISSEIIVLARIIMLAGYVYIYIGFYSHD